jgi:site-specific DNA-methyltransferase (adenine-specific)
MENNIITLYEGDCLELMKHIPDKSIDAIITDPPYGTTACKWDSVIDFKLMWEQLNRIIKPNGAILLFGSEPFSSALRMSNIKNYRYDWYWKKSKAGLFQHAKNRPMKAIETISVFSLAKWGHKSQVKNRLVYYPQGVKSIGEKTVTKNFNAGGIATERPNQVGKKYESFTGLPNDFLEYPNIVGKSVIHPTQKPVLLMEYLIKTYTNEGETVLDFTMGSGTTGVACVNTKRNFIGIEKDDNYFKIAKKRIDDAKQQEK